MMVCAHGNVAEYCADKGMEIVATWDGKILDYRGKCPVLVTDSEMSENEYYFLKGEMYSRGVELISTKHKDNKQMSEYLAYAAERRSAKSGGRPRFEDPVVSQRVLELRSKGLSLRAIQESEGVRHPDGRKLSLNTINNIIRSKKENG